MNLIRALALGAMSLVILPRETLVKRKLDDVAVISLPRSVKEEIFKGVRSDQPGRLVFTFATSYFWASMGSGTAYKQFLCVSILAPDASAADYALPPATFPLHYGNRKRVRQLPIGNAHLDISEGLYQQNTLEEPSGIYLYADPARRLQIMWHAAKSEIKMDDVPELIRSIAASFAIMREPTAAYAEMRDRPAKEAEDRAHRLSAAKEMLAREGFPALVPGQPVLKDGMYVEWMIDPEPRFQLLVLLGTVKPTPNVMGGVRPRPAPLKNADGTRRELPGSVGWHEYWEDEWHFTNRDDAYLPMKGIGARLAAQHKDPALMLFYYAATVRVEETPVEQFTNLRWFRGSVPEVQRLWREGALVTGAIDEAPFPIRRN